MDTATHEIELPGPDQLTLESEERRRLLELAAVVREHQARIQSQVGSARAHDLILYRRLRQIGGRPLLFSLEDAIREHQAATASTMIPRRPADHQLYRSLE